MNMPTLATFASSGATSAIAYAILLKFIRIGSSR
jgi:hypothetical protein